MGSQCSTCNQQAALSIAHKTPEEDNSRSVEYEINEIRSDVKPIKGLIYDESIDHSNQKGSRLLKVPSADHMEKLTKKRPLIDQFSTMAERHKPDHSKASETDKLHPLSVKAKKAEAKLPKFELPPETDQEVFDSMLKPPGSCEAIEQHGPLLYSQTGDSYKGGFFRGMRHGFGELVTISGAYYIGEWKYDYQCGVGRLVYENGDVYEGTFMDGMAHGYGRFLNYSTGSVYQGEFSCNFQNGFGAEYYNDGSFYKGNWEANMKEGQGEYQLGDGTRYLGDFRKGKIDGQGTCHYPDGSVYKGQWKDNVKQGVGTYEYAEDKTVYKGDFYNGEKEGVGEIRWPDGDMFVGNFREGLQHGVGWFVHRTGKRVKGVWRNGKRVKWLKDGEPYEFPSSSKNSARTLRSIRSIRSFRDVL